MRAISKAGYIPDALPFDDNRSFWEMLREEKEPTENMAKWLELDLDEYSKLGVEKLVTEGDDK